MRSSSWLWVLVLAFVACSDDKANGDDDGNDDDVARSLTVAQTTPAAAATNVPVGATTVVITFSEGLDAETVPASLSAVVGESAVAETHTVDGSNLSVTITTATYATPCTVTIPAGLRSALGAELAEDYRLSFTTAAQPMVEAFELQSGADIGTGVRRQLGIDDAGGVVAIWQGASQQSSFRSRAAGSNAWSSPMQINEGLSPILAVAPSGEAMVLANRSVGVSEWRNFSRRLASGILGVNQQASTTGETQERPDLVMQTGGTAAIVYSTTTGVNDSVHLLKHNGTSWAASNQTIDNLHQVAREPRLATDAAGNVWTLWSSFDGSTAQLRTSYCFGSGACSMTTVLDTSSENAFAVDLGMNRSGVAIALWTEGAGDTLRHWVSSATASAWATPAPLGEAGNIVGDGRVAVCDSGSAFVVYTQTDASVDRDDIWVSRFANGAFAAPVRVEELLFDAKEPRVVCDAAGNATVAWLQEFEGVASIWTNRYSGGAWSGARLAETHAAIIDNLDLATNPKGQVMLWWVEHTGGTKSVWVGSVQ